MPFYPLHLLFLPLNIFYNLRSEHTILLLYKPSSVILFIFILSLLVYSIYSKSHQMISEQLYKSEIVWNAL